MRPGAVAIAVLVLAAAAPSCARDSAERPEPGGERAGSVALGADAPVPVLAVPSAYRLRWRLEDWRGGRHRTGIESLEVRRPFESRRISQLEDEAVFEQVSDFGGWSFPGPNGAYVTAPIAPNVAVGDVRLERELVEALPQGLLERREVRRVAGRPCQVYRAATSVTTEGNLLRDRKEGEYADVCVDGAGLLLEQLWVVGGEVVQWRIVEDVVVEPKDLPSAFELRGDLAPLGKGGGTVAKVDETTAPNPARDLWALPSPPEGFATEGRFVVVHAAGEDEPPDEARRLESIVDVYTRGPDLVVVDNAATRDGHEAFPPRHRDHETVEVPGLGTAELVPSARASEVRVLLGGGRAVRVYGTLPFPRLVELARTLAPRA